MQVSWIDPDRIAELAQLLRARPKTPPPKEDPLGLELIMQSELLAADGLTNPDFADAFGGIEDAAALGASETTPVSSAMSTAGSPDKQPGHPNDTPPSAVAVSITQFDVPAADLRVTVTEIDDPADKGEVTIVEYDVPPESLSAAGVPVVEVHLSVAESAGPDIEPMPAAEELAHSPELDAIRNQLQAIRERAIGAGLLTPQTPSPPSADPIAGASGSDAPPAATAPSSPFAPVSPLADTADAPVTDISFEVPLGTVVQRLDAFAGWALRRLGGGDVLIVDQQGDLLWGPQTKAGLILSTMMACSAAMHASAMAACAVPPSIQQPLASGNLLTIIPCPTRLGMLQIAIARPDLVPVEEAELLRQALTVAIDTEGI